MRKLKGVIYDWAGTLCDRGSLSPVLSFIDAFQRVHINITMKEARTFMGLNKKEHIIKILELPSVKIQCKDNTIHNPDHIYYNYKIIQKDTLVTTAIDGAIFATNIVRRLGLKNGVTTGYTKDLSDIVLNSITKQNVIIDNVVASDEVKYGRPHPYMIFKCLENMNIMRPSSIVKIGDTISDMEEGINAGCWTIGVSKWSNETNYESYQDIEDATENEIVKRSEHAKSVLYDAGADFVIDDLTKINTILTKIDNLMCDSIDPITYRYLIKKMKL